MSSSKLSISHGFSLIHHSFLSITTNHPNTVFIASRQNYVPRLIQYKKFSNNEIVLFDQNQYYSIKTNYVILKFSRIKFISDVT